MLQKYAAIQFHEAQLDEESHSPDRADELII
jgi:hypothetical protein